MNELSDDLMEEFNFSICLELIREHNPNVTEDEAKVIWDKCSGNPFNAGILYKMVELAKNQENLDPDMDKILKDNLWDLYERKD